MAQESGSSTPFSSSESGWKCRALATFSTKCNNESSPFDSLWFRRHSKIHVAEVELCSGLPAITTFKHFWEKTFWPATLSTSNSPSWIICVEFRSLIHGLNPPLSSKTAAMCRHHLQLWFSLQGRALVAPTDTCSYWQLNSIAQYCT